LPIADALGLSEEALFEWMADAGQRGILRRFAGVLRHREAGFGANGMGVWAVPAEVADRVGAAFAQDPRVTHCYRRPTFDGWPYSHFTMVHGRSREECDAALAELAAAVPGWTSRSALYSTREFKKERVKYFLEDAPAASRP
jgi:DNA-binding Lrp family transcriptional regulator